MLLSSLYFAIVMFQFSSSSRQGNSSFYSCDPFLDCKNGGFGAFVPNPEDCNSYYICVNSAEESVPADISFACPDGQYFDQSTGSCVTESTPCTNECYTFCNLECTTTYQSVVYPGDCSKFYFCYTLETKVEMNCPPNDPYFNGAECTNNPYVCCDSCTPYCTEEFKEIEDPLDCHSFYICIDIGVPAEEYHGVCPDGEHFDSVTNLCKNGEKCTPICGDVSATTVSTTTSSSSNIYHPSTDPAY